MISVTKENYGYIIRTDVDGYFILSTFVNVRGKDPVSWCAVADVLLVKSYKTINAATKKGNTFIVENN